MSDDDPDDAVGSDGDDDPFERLGSDADRAGDPFERLGDADEEADGDGDRGTPDDEREAARDQWGPPGEDRRRTAAEDDWLDPTRDDVETADDGAARTSDSGAVTGPTDDAGPTADSGPMDETGTGTPADQVRTDHAGDDPDPFGDVETPTESPFDRGEGGVFERVDVARADPDQVWAEITGEDDDEGRDDDESPETPDRGRYSEVSKHAFCERCEFFSGPPDVECSHETAEIIEFLDMETVRLLNCPVVAEREALEREG